MKRFYAYLVAAFALTATACSTDPTEEIPAEPIQTGTVEMTFSASNETRTTLDYENRATMWCEDDKISILDDQGGNNPFTIKETDGITASFQGKVNEGATKFVAVYPYNAAYEWDGTTISGITIPTAQVCTAGTFPEGANITVAVADENYSLAFKNVCAVVKFQVEKSCSSVTFATNGTEAVAGTVSVDFDESGIPVATATAAATSIELTCEADFQPETNYFFVAVPNTLTSGITAKIDGWVSRTTEKPQVFNRSIIKDLLTLPEVAKTTIYLVPGTWASDGPSYSVAFWKGETNGEEMMTIDPDKHGVYKADVVTNIDGLLFKRLSADGKSEWNHTLNTTLPTDEKNHYYIMGWEDDTYKLSYGEWREYVVKEWALAGTFNAWEDLKMERQSADISVAKGVALKAYNDLFKVKTVGGWDENYGAGFSYMNPSSYMPVTMGGGDIAITAAGTYDIYFDEAKLLLYVVNSGADYQTATEQTQNGAAPVTGNIYYFKPNSNWTQSGAKFSAYFWNGSGNKWAELTDTDKDGYYECNLGEWTPTQVIYLRKNPSGYVYNNWTCWNRIGNITVKSGMNCYTMASGVWSQQIENGSGYTGGTWSKK